MTYGGNTSCVEVNAGDQQIILDAGTGLRRLGYCNIQNNIQKSTILFSHTHWDHITGFPFFAPVFQDKSEITLLAGHLYSTGGIKKVLTDQMMNPIFPVPIDALEAKLSFQDFRAGETFTIGDDIKIETALLNHPGDATGYRINYRDKSLCYITDTEHVPDRPDTNILNLITNSDLLIYDSTYTPEEFPAKIGWGHSTWDEGLRLAKQANVKTFAVFHHDPNHNDTFMQELELKVRKRWSSAFIAKENMQISLD